MIALVVARASASSWWCFVPVGDLVGRALLLAIRFGGLGAVGVFAGLYLVARTEPSSLSAPDVGEPYRGSVGTKDSSQSRFSVSRFAVEALEASGLLASTQASGHVSGLGSSEDPPAYIRSSSFTATPLFQSVDTGSHDWGSESSVGDHGTVVDSALNDTLDAALIANPRPHGARR
jgi:hypothetical protein